MVSNSRALISPLVSRGWPAAAAAARSRSKASAASFFFWIIWAYVNFCPESWKLFAITKYPSSTFGVKTSNQWRFCPTRKGRLSYLFVVLIKHLYFPRYNDYKIVAAGTIFERANLVGEADRGQGGTLESSAECNTCPRQQTKWGPQIFWEGPKGIGQVVSKSQLITSFVLVGWTHWVPLKTDAYNLKT